MYNTYVFPRCHAHPCRLVILVQLQAQVGQAATAGGPGLPSAVRWFYKQMSIFLFTGIAVSPVCFGGPSVVFRAAYGEMETALVLAVALLAVYARCVRVLRRRTRVHAQVLAVVFRA